MASSQTVSKLYEQFTPRERVTLVLQAWARGDQAEGTRLRSSCPRKTYTMMDVSVTDRLEMSFDRMTVVCIDLRYMFGQLQLLHDTMDVLGPLTAQHHQAATLAFFDGFRCGQGKPPFDHSSLAEDDEDDEEPADDEPGDENNNAENAVADPADYRKVEGDEAEEPELDLCGWLDGVTKRSIEATARIRQVLVNTAAPIAQDLIDVCAALGQFCQTHLGIDAPTLLRAWGLASMHDFTEMIALYAHLTPRAEKVSEYSAYIEEAWVECFGREELG